ncbi:cytochrome P450 [Amycolatopsis bartoniae]|uniref:Putative cytochrome P450 135A1 n=1 Tax=Amycolatopsis bartoniae TaxID=941986 RepID=A0A8H9M9T0_9PSEU|nr:cytochrome P450 [Amycolatopsis bartoniae]MBB2936969.1 cytochrome P450 [Amycolatopsis bartoniae]TVT06447.1 cytochrome P450 [Amycolatopsis bartoniae]GHF51539.1 putative cytochrome P450 135A1 [Amycolatopsis bartoniae]
MTSTLPRTRSATLPPGPKLPVLAQTLLFANFRHRLLPYWRRRYGDVFTVRLYPGRNAVQLAGLDDIKAVFSGPVTTFHAGEGNVILKPIMGEHSVLLTDEDVHLRARKLLMPAFHGAALRGYRTMITELAEQEVSRWPAGQVFRSHERMQALTLEIILRVVFGVGEGARLDELRRLLTDLVDIGVLDLFGFHNEKLRSFGPWRRSRLLQERVDELLYAEIADRRAAPDLAERDDVLSRLLTVPAEDDRLSDAELRDQLVTLLLAGHETTATALAWSFHELARDPVRLRRALEAADSGDEKYLEAVAKEAMRLRPVISEVARRLTEEVEVGGYLLPAGTTVMPSIALVHGDPAHHAAPEEFRPERFLADGGPASGTWFPFGGGVRRCLGAGFSLLEATIVLRAVLSRFSLAPDRPRPEGSRPRHITMVPARGARISVTPRA